MVNLNTNKTLNIILPNTNKALKEILQSASKEEMKVLTKGKDLNSILNSIFKESSKEAGNNKLLLDLVKNTPTLKGLGNVDTNIKELLTTLKQEKNPLPLEKQLKTFLSDIKDMTQKGLQAKLENSGVFLESKIKNLQTPQLQLKTELQELSVQLEKSSLPNVKVLNTQIKELLTSDLFKSISNSDLLKTTLLNLENVVKMSSSVSKLLNTLQERINSPLDKTLQPKDILFSKEIKDITQTLKQSSKVEQLSVQTKDIFSQDFKAVLLKAHEEISNMPNKNVDILKAIDKLTLQIDYQQLLSHLSNATSLYIPYSWDMLEEGNITIKKAKDDKFFTDIELQLKEYGLLKLRLGMFEKKQLNINITTENKKFKEILQKSIPELKQALFAVGVTPNSIRFIEDNDKLNSAYSDAKQTLNAGFEAKA